MLLKVPVLPRKIKLLKEFVDSLQEDGMILVSNWSDGESAHFLALTDPLPSDQTL
jgi:hypothetical protein